MGQISNQHYTKTLLRQSDTVYVDVRLWDMRENLVMP